MWVAVYVLGDKQHPFYVVDGYNIWQKTAQMINSTDFNIPERRKYNSWIILEDLHVHFRLTGNLNFTH